MLLWLIGLIFVIITTYFVYKNAKDYDRNGILWALITFFAGLGIQWVFPIILMIALSILLLVSGSSQIEIQSFLLSYATPISVGSIILSGIVVLLILRYISKMPEEKGFEKPPSPPEFN